MERIDNDVYMTSKEYYPIEERVFFKTAVGVSINEHYRIATSEELAEWEEYKKQHEELTNNKLVS